MKDKTERLLEILESPGLYDEESVRSLLEDPETAEIYKAINKTADSLTETTEPEIDKEWEAFMAKNRHAFSNTGTGIFRWLPGRNVAAAVAIAAASLSLLAAGIGIGYKVSNNNVNPVAGKAVVDKSSSVKLNETVGDTLAGESSSGLDVAQIVFKDEPLEKILAEISHYYGIPVVYKSDKVKDLHLYFKWNRSLSLDETISRLNLFQQINIMVSDESIIVE
ncbi:MAG: DUF4974 domain-containing protein [Muribaculaceae bacterium]|nr:DUF4974 domain-containing protein [Muribaculaceae bacterium]